MKRLLQHVFSIAGLLLLLRLVDLDEKGALARHVLYAWIAFFILISAGNLLHESGLGPVSSPLVQQLLTIGGVTVLHCHPLPWRQRPPLPVVTNLLQEPRQRQTDRLVRRATLVEKRRQMARRRRLRALGRVRRTQLQPSGVSSADADVEDLEGAGIHPRYMKRSRVGAQYDTPQPGAEGEDGLSTNCRCCLRERPVAQPRQPDANPDAELSPVSRVIYHWHNGRMVETVISRRTDPTAVFRIKNPTGLPGRDKGRCANVASDEVHQDKSQLNVDTGDRGDPGRKTNVQDVEPSGNDSATPVADIVDGTKNRPPEQHPETEPCPIISTSHQQEKGKEEETSVRHDSHMTKPDSSSNAGQKVFRVKDAGNDPTIPVAHTVDGTKNRLPEQHPETETCPVISASHQQEKGKEEETSVSHNSHMSKPGPISNAGQKVFHVKDNAVLLRRQKYTDGDEGRRHKPQLNINTVSIGIQTKESGTQQLKPTHSEPAVQAADTEYGKDKQAKAHLEAESARIVSAISQGGSVPVVAPSLKTGQKDIPTGLPPDVVSNEVSQNKSLLNVNTDCREDLHKGGCMQQLKPTGLAHKEFISNEIGRGQVLDSGPTTTDSHKAKAESSVTQPVVNRKLQVMFDYPSKGQVQNEITGKQSRRGVLNFDEKTGMGLYIPKLPKGSVDVRPVTLSLETKNNAQQSCSVGDGSKQHRIIYLSQEGEVHKPKQGTDFDEKTGMGLYIPKLPKGSVDVRPVTSSLETKNNVQQSSTVGDGSKQHRIIYLSQEREVHKPKQGTDFDEKTGMGLYIPKLPKGSVDVRPVTSSLETKNNVQQSSTVGDGSKQHRIIYLSQEREGNKPKQGTAPNDGFSCMLPRSSASIGAAAAANVRVSRGKFSESNELRTIKRLSGEQNPPLAQECVPVVTIHEDTSTWSGKPCPEKVATEVSDKLTTTFTVPAKKGKRDKPKKQICSLGKRCFPVLTSPRWSNSPRASAASKSRPRVISDEQRQLGMLFRHQNRKACEKCGGPTCGAVSGKSAKNRPRRGDAAEPEVQQSNSAVGTNSPLVITLSRSPVENSSWRILPPTGKTSASARSSAPGRAATPPASEQAPTQPQARQQPPTRARRSLRFVLSHSDGAEHCK